MLHFNGCSLNDSRSSILDASVFGFFSSLHLGNPETSNGRLFYEGF
jgi:hypothetical protein